MISKHARLVLAIIFLPALLSCSAFAGPPFLTDDPEPVEFRHYEFYTFTTLDRLSSSELTPQSRRSTTDYAVFVPAWEFNAGVAPELQLHVVVPLALTVATSNGTAYGIGDIELGAKYRFIKEKKWLPQVGTFPMLELPSGNSSRGLGNGTIWAKLPIWLQKSWGPWTSYGGVGYAINHAPGMRDHVLAGWQLQRELNKKLTLGIEWFNPGRDTSEGEGTQLVNAGGIYNFREGFSLLFTAGHSMHGESHTVAYIGLYWTWGARRAEDEPAAAHAWGSAAIAALKRCGPHCI
jgi:hypothetical protein